MKNMDARTRATEYAERVSARACQAWPFRCHCGSTDHRTESLEVRPRRTIKMWICRSCGARLGPAIADAKWLDWWYRSREVPNA
jgi:predicted SprT family Zn-dependent metalloprotease